MASKRPRKILWIEKDERDFTPIETIPEEYMHLIIPYAGVFFYRDADCDMVCQNIKLKDFSIWTHEVFANTDILLAPFTPRHILALHYMDADSVMADIFERGPFRLGAEEVNLFNLHSHFHKALVGADKVVFSFHINIEPGILPDLARRYPQLHNLSTKKITDESGTLNLKPYKITPASRGLLLSMWKCRLLEVQAEYFLHRCCVDLFINFARQDELSSIESSSTPAIDATLSEVFEYLTENVQGKYDVDKLAALYNMEPEVLESAFEHLYFITPEAYLHQQKMMTAYNLIVKTKTNMSMIARKTGYKTKRELWMDFEAYYGCSPVAVSNAQ
ncbi:MAG TPA: helix-turn-helix domain-containing protein [Chitinophaga sp.]|uniref:helix-turn-helix domain-containing protein n=1 Tax=Chitinophaga sp. TaxID=1869181 RepID=UPI002BE424F5|nr:helix-turn-helix domain-containing protein [Chitinophaga sp.]HVI44923.1 helix-turn-helix domain-containing protein [Chitinophaga sp.]